MARIEKGQSYADLGFKVDGKGIATDLTTGQSLPKAEVDKRLQGSGYSQLAKSRGGIAGVYDRNKKVINPIMEVGLGLLPGIGPALAAGYGAAVGGFDHEGQGGIKPVSHAEVIEVFSSNNERVKQGIFKIIETLPKDRTCSCGSALSGAR